MDMFSNKKWFLYFGPLTVLIEWIGLLISSLYIRNFNPNNAVSVIGSGPWPLPLIFGMTFTLVGISYFVFSLSLKSYSQYIPKIALLAGIAFAVAGWVPFRGDGGSTDIIHNVSSYIATLGYISMVWLMQKHPHRKISRSSTILARLLILFILVMASSLYFFHWYIAYLELLILFVIQCWTILVVWHERKPAS